MAASGSGTKTNEGKNIVDLITKRDADMAAPKARFRGVRTAAMVGAGGVLAGALVPAVASADDPAPTTMVDAAKAGITGIAGDSKTVIILCAVAGFSILGLFVVWRLSKRGVQKIG